MPDQSHRIPGMPAVRGGSYTLEELTRDPDLQYRPAIDPSSPSEIIEDDGPDGEDDTE